MTTLPSLLVAHHPSGVLQLTINREAQLNALNIATMLELERVLLQARGNEQVRAILITGAGERAFAAGADINEFTQLEPEQSRSFAEQGQRILQILETMPIPVVAAVNGLALGGGCELALACHLRVASERAIIGLPEVKLGIIPGYGGTQRLPRLVGTGYALEIMLTGEPLSADEARRIGLVNYVVAPSELVPFCFELLNKILKNAPYALARILEVVVAEESNYQTEAKAFEACCNTQDFREGVTAFLTKRSPHFMGS